MPPKSSSKFLSAFYLALIICTAQIVFTWIFAPKDKTPLNKYYQMEVAPGWDTTTSKNFFLNGYQRFNNWDSLRFFEIAQNGFHLPADPKTISYPDIHQYRANITNLPTYPLLVRYVQKILHCPPQYALLIAAQLACALFWLYFLLYFLERDFTKKEALMAAATFGFAPGAFYLVCGYSESTLLAAEMGLIFWTDRLAAQLQKGLKQGHNSKDIEVQNWITKSVSGSAVALHGFLATFSRLPAIPLALYPFLKLALTSGSLAKNKARVTVLNGTLLTLFSASGLALFLFYCQAKFGRWDIYFYLSKLIGQEPDYLAIFKPSSYLPRFFFEDTQLSMNRAMVPWLVAVAAFTYRLDLHKKSRLALYSIAAGLFYITLAGKAGGGMDGMIRYSIPIYLPLVICFATVLRERKQSPVLKEKNSIPISWGIVTFYLFSLSCQAWCAYRYLHGRWVS
jgi:hypothetical protein